jgi:hypothetical protein
MLHRVGMVWTDLSKLRQPSEHTVLFGDTNPNSFEAKDVPIRKIFVSIEPEAICKAEDFMIENHSKWYAILTFNDRVLRECPNAYKYIFGTTWVSEQDWGQSSAKTFGVSGLFGSKQITNQGHPFRMRIYTKQTELQIPYTFFRSSKQNPHLKQLTRNPFIKDSKLDLFTEFQFSITIENSRQENYFTEKLLDCLLTKTIPIYYGCPNIGEFFNTRGWILLETTDETEAIAKLNTLTPDWYAEYSDVIEHNFKQAQLYVDWHTNLNRALDVIPDY